MQIKEVIAKSQLSFQESRAKRTATTYVYGLKKFAMYLTDSGIGLDQPVTDLTVDHFIYFQGWLGAQRLSRSTKMVYISSAQALMEWMVIQGLIEPTYQETLRYKMSVSTVSRKRQEKLPKVPTPEEIDTLLSSVHSAPNDSPVKERNIALIEFLVSTGCRASEAAQLLIRDVDLDKRRAKVTGKGNKERYVFLSPRSVMAFRSYWSIRGFQDQKYPAFTGHSYGWETGKIKPISAKTIWLTVKELVKLSGIDEKRFSPHWFRHAFATKMLANTGNLALVQDLMGHSSPASTRVYAKITADQLQESHRKVYG